MLKVKYLRIKKGVSQSKLERDLKINHAIYSSIEGERMNRPYDYILERLSEYLSCPIEELLTSVTPEQEEEINEIERQMKSKSGKAGGTATLLLYGKRHMQNIGRRGSVATKSKNTGRGEQTA